MRSKWGDLISLEYGKPVPDKEKNTGSVPVFGTNGQIGTTNQPPLCPYPSFVIGRKGAYRGVHFSEKPFSVIDTAFYVKSKTENLDLKWAYYKFLTYDINKMDSGSAIPSTDRYEIYGISVELPTINEQRTIAGILTSLDQKIRHNAAINHHLEQLARTVFRHWFVENEEVEGWEIGKLGEFITINERSITKSYPKDEIEYIDISSISLGHLEDTTTYALKDSPSRARRLVKHGDTIWSTVRPNRKSYMFISNPKENLVVSTGFAVLTPKKIPSSFLFFFTTTDEFVDYLVSNADGSAYPAVLPDRFAEAEFPVPPEDVLNKFENVASPVLAQITHNEKESRMLASLRDSLLPKLLSGELSVADIDAK